MLAELLRYPIRDGSRVELLVLGGGLHLLATWLPVLPLVLVLGYLGRLAAATAGDDPPPAPAWRPLAGLVVLGLRLAATAIGYLLVPVTLLVVTLGGPIDGSRLLGGADSIVFIAGTTLATALAVALLYPLPAALVAVAKRGRLRAALDRGLLGTATRDAGYLVAVLLSGAGLGLLAALYGPLNRLALGFFLAFYVEVVVAIALTSATMRAWRRAGREPPTANAPAPGPD
jgi:hypothetical protein